MSEFNFDYDDNSNMMPPDHVEQEYDHKTDYVMKGSDGKTLTDEEIEAIKNRRIKTKYGYDNKYIKWENLTDESNFKQVDKFKGGFGEVLILKCEQDGGMIVVKKNCKGDNTEFDTATCMAIPGVRVCLIERKMTIKSKWPVTFDWKGLESSSFEHSKA